MNLSPMVAPLLGDAQHMTATDHTRVTIHKSQQPLSYYPPGLRQPIQPRTDMPRSNQLSNGLPVFVPQTGNNQMLRYATPYGKQDPVREAVMKLAEKGVARTFSKPEPTKQPKSKAQSKGKSAAIFRVTPKK